MYNKHISVFSLLLAVIAARPTVNSTLSTSFIDGCADPGRYQCAVLIEATQDNQDPVNIIGGSCGGSIQTSGSLVSTSTGSNNNDPINYHGVFTTSYGPHLELWATRINLPPLGINGVHFVYNGNSYSQNDCLLKEGQNGEWLTLQCNFSC